jgi:membrane-bound ClpP family serine protease
MAMWIIIISLLAIGLGLIIVELVFIPGTTVVGLLGLIFSVVGIVISYSHFGHTTGFYILMCTSVTTLLALFYSFRTGAWTRFSLKSSMNNKVNEGLLNDLSVGDEGTTRSALRPMGTAEFGSQQYEVRSLGSFVESGSRIKIVQILSNQIIVEPIN